MSTISFVTGGTGFIGKSLVNRLLAEGHTVRLLARDPKKARRLFGKDAAIIPGDLKNPEALKSGTKGADIVFHLAAQVGDFGPRRGYYETNVNGTKAVVDAADGSNISRFVYMSTNAVTGMKRTAVTDETAPYADTGGHYGISKGRAERIIRDRHRENGFPGVVLRPPIVYGPECYNFVIRPLTMIKHGKMVLVGRGVGLCWHVYIENLIDAVMLAAARPDAAGEVFIISDGKDDTTWRDYFNLLAATAGYGPVTKNVPAPVARSVARVSYALYSLFGIPPMLTPMGVGILTSGAPVSIRKAQTVLGYKPRVDLDRGMKKVGEWLRQGGRQYLNSAGRRSR
jgi:nucleoside-diphosphate-sugar epimerase